MPEVVRVGLAMLAAVITAAAIVRGSRGGRMMPPGFASPARRGAALLMLVLVLYAGAFAPLFFWDQVPEFDPQAVHVAELFAVQVLLLLSLLTWFVLGYPRTGSDGTAVPELRAWPSPEVLPAAEPAASPEAASEVSVAPPVPARSWWQELVHQCGLDAERPGREVALGVALGFGVWGVVVVLMVLLGLVLSALGLGEELPTEPVPQVMFLASQPVWLRVCVCLAAGVSEEIFFRGFLQARIGVLASSLLFALAHLGYGQPLMVVGILLLALIFAAVVRRRRNVGSVIVAHAVFDMIQLLVVLPLVVENLGAGGASSGGLS